MMQRTYSTADRPLSKLAASSCKIPLHPNGLVGNTPSQNVGVRNTAH